MCDIRLSEHRLTHNTVITLLSRTPNEDVHAWFSVGKLPFPELWNSGRFIQVVLGLLYARALQLGAHTAAVDGETEPGLPRCG